MTELVEYYNNSYSKKQLEGDLARKNRLMCLFTEPVTGKKIISIGCGPAVDINFLIKSNEVHGIDISDEALKHVADAGIIPHKIDLTVVKRLPFDDNYFDIIVATDILEHLFFPKDLLVEIQRILKPDGYAIISVPNHFYWRGRLAVLKGRGIVLHFHKANVWDYFHIRFFTISSFEALLIETNLEIKERHYDKFTDVPKGFPHFIDKWLIKKYPAMFSMHFLVKAVKNEHQPDDAY